jgi:hypothetical protein
MSVTNNITGVDCLPTLFLGAVRRIKMTLDSILRTVEERLFEVHLFVRYFDFSDLEALGFNSDT